MNYKINQRIILLAHTYKPCGRRYFRSIVPSNVGSTCKCPTLLTSYTKGVSLFCKGIKSLTPSIASATSSSSIKQFLIGQDIGYLEGYTCYIVECRFCRRKTHQRGDPCKIYINMTTGDFMGLKCQIWGSWQDFQDMILLAKKDNRPFSSVVKEPNWLPTKAELKPVMETYQSATAITSELAPSVQQALHSFHLDELSNDVLERYEARIIPDKSVLLLPIYSVNGLMVGLHRLTKSLNESSHSIESDVLPRSLQSALFGYQRLNLRQESIVITDSPVETMIFAQENRTNVVNLPQSKCLPLEVLPLLESFKKIILWFDNNVSMWHMAKMFAQKLNEKRCYVIRTDDQSLTPFEAVKKKLELNSILKMARPLSHRSITTFHSLRQDVYMELSRADQIAGVQWKRFPFLNKLLKGHRRGELTIFTGPTGSGKTTWMSEYSLDLCIQGVRTLWGSFEIRNTRLAKIMMMQFAQCPMDKFLEEYDVWADKFESLPLFFLTFHGPESVKNVLDAMRHAVYIHDIEHVVVDNLQFMLGASESTHNFDRFWKQDLVIASFRQFATVYNCHVSLVIHPRKEDSEELTNMSIFGGAKATQEADNVLILQNRMSNTLRGKKYIQITKNRFDGELGIFPLDFDGETRSFALKKEKKLRKTIVMEDLSTKVHKFDQICLYTV